MSEVVSVRLAEDVWGDLCMYEAYRPALDRSVRKALAQGTRTSPPDKGWIRQAPFRTLTLTVDQAEEMEAWLTDVVARTHAPIASVVAFIVVREARFRALARAGWICASCLAGRTGATAIGVQESLQRIAERAVLTTDVARCDRCGAEGVVYRIG